MKSFLVAIASDIHFDVEDPVAWGAFREWHREHKPDTTVLGGDIIDLGMLSRYEQSGEDPQQAVPQIRTAVREINALAKESGQVYVSPGNHEERWAKALLAGNAPKFAGAVGLTLQEQFRAQGLARTVKWVTESASCPGIWLGAGAVLVRHGHKQANKFGQLHLTAKMLRDCPRVSQVHGHHHRAQLSAHTSLGKTVIAIANPHLSGPHEYSPDPCWQRGFTVLEFWGGKTLPQCNAFTPHLVIMDESGRFAWGRKVYGTAK